MRIILKPYTSICLYRKNHVPLHKIFTAFTVDKQGSVKRYIWLHMARTKPQSTKADNKNKNSDKLPDAISFSKQVHV